MPVCFVSARNGAGIGELLDVFVKLMPNPTEGNPPQVVKGQGDKAQPATEAGLDDRKAAVLRAIIEEYVASAQPVGSATVTKSADLGVSAATVRNEMSLLEREGYIAQPHTSAGRIPTDRGYRYYVDHLAGESTLAAPERRRIAEFFTTATVAMDDLLSQTSQLLARITAQL